MATKKTKAEPAVDSPRNPIWARIEHARLVEGWTERAMGRQLLGTETAYTTIKARGWSCKAETRDQIVEKLTERGWSEEWLLLGRSPERTDGKLVRHVPTQVSTKLRRLARRLGLPEAFVITQWLDMEAPGDSQVEKWPEEIRRAALAAVHLDDRTFEEVQVAVAVAVEEEDDGARHDPEWWLGRIRAHLPKRSRSGTRPSPIKVKLER